jgi:hypothetical protein
LGFADGIMRRSVSGLIAALFIQTSCKAAASLVLKSAIGVLADALVSTPGMMNRLNRSR